MPQPKKDRYADQFCSFDPPRQPGCPVSGYILRPQCPVAQSASEWFRGPTAVLFVIGRRWACTLVYVVHVW